MALSGNNEATQPTIAVGAAGNPPIAVPKPSANNPFIARDLDFSVNWLSMVVYGDFGAGKTYLAGTSALVDEYSDVLYLSLEGGEKALKQLVRDGRAMGIDVGSRVLVIPIQTYKQYANIYEFLKLHVKFRDADDIVNLRRLEAQIRGMTPAQCSDNAFLEAAIPKPKKLRMVITDSLTEAQKYCMYQILGIDPLVQRLDAEPDSAEWKDWGASRDMIQFLVRRLRDLPIHSIFCCGEEKEQDAAKRFYYAPMLPGKLAADVRGLVDCVGYLKSNTLEGGKIQRQLLLVGGFYGSTNFAAKHRFGNSLKGAYLEDPSMVEIYRIDNLD